MVRGKITKNNVSKNKSALSDDSNPLMEMLVAKRGKSYVCKICNNSAKDPIDAMVHIMDHGSSALEGVSRLIKDQRDGKVSKSALSEINATV
ncbi:MAG: hypothetical protein KGI06_01680 [Candidatus Micrarchaeota archaeon]|nr:hypothetical protein [Candidatus Micrarchaeota archaeon]